MDTSYRSFSQIPVLLFSSLFLNQLKRLVKSSGQMVSQMKAEVPAVDKQCIMLSQEDRIYSRGSKRWTVALEGHLCPLGLKTTQFSSVAQSCLILCDPMNHSTQGLPVHHHLPEFTQTKAHLTSHSRMSGPRCVITASWISGSWRLFLYSSPGYSYHLFLISSASVRSISFLSFIEPILASMFPWYL